MSIREELYETIMEKLSRPLGDFASPAAAFIVDAILARWALVDIPEADADGNYRPRGGDGPKGATRVIIDPWCATRVAIDDLSRRTSFTPEQARTIAAGLLAAANDAEGK